MREIAPRAGNPLDWLPANPARKLIIPLEYDKLFLGAGNGALPAPPFSPLPLFAPVARSLALSLLQCRCGRRTLLPRRLQMVRDQGGSAPRECGES